MFDVFPTLCLFFIFGNLTIYISKDFGSKNIGCFWFSGCDIKLNPAPCREKMMPGCRQTGHLKTATGLKSGKYIEKRKKNKKRKRGRE